MTLLSVSEIAAKINDRARELAPELLPNGCYSQGKDRWMFSGIADHGRSTSAWVHLSGPKTGKWFDMGNAAPGEDKGDMIDLLRLRLGLADQRAAIEEAKVRLGISNDWKPGKPAQLPPEELARRAREASERQARRETEQSAERSKRSKSAKALYLGGASIEGTPAEAYLIGRQLEGGGRGGWPGVLRFRGDVTFVDDDGSKRREPAMLAAVYLASGEQIGTHRTYLQRDPARGWIKLQVPNPKKVMGSMWGGFIPIHKGASGKSMSQAPADEPFYITEGIEDALVVRMMMPGVRILSAISLANIGAILLPPPPDGGQRRVVIVCDRDDNAKAQEQLERSIAQQQARGNDVRLVMPPKEYAGHPVKDMNDWLVAVKAEAGRAAEGQKRKGVG